MNLYVKRKKKSTLIDPCLSEGLKVLMAKEVIIQDGVVIELEDERSGDSMIETGENIVAVVEEEKKDVVEAMECPLEGIKILESVEHREGGRREK